MQRPLEGIRVLDLGQIYQGPYCGMILSYLGADVIKVERPGGETIRDRSVDGETPEVQFLNPSKRGITLNLKTEDGKQALRDLVEKADVLIENFATGKMDELGLGYEDLTEINPELVYGHGSGYGDSGPYTRFPAMDLTIQAMGGVMQTTGFPDAPPVKCGPAISDFLGGVHLATGIVSALFQRERTGEGQYVEVGMFDCIYPTLTSPLSAWAKELDAPPRTGNQHSGMAIAPYNVYEVTDGYLAIICIAERHWDALVNLMDRPELNDVERFSSKAKRANHVEEIRNSNTVICSTIVRTRVMVGRSFRFQGCRSSSRPARTPKSPAPRASAKTPPRCCPRLPTTPTSASPNWTKKVRSKG
jgi:CoA:oxalate CoA-transferase